MGGGGRRRTERGREESHTRESLSKLCRPFAFCGDAAIPIIFAESYHCTMYNIVFDGYDVGGGGGRVAFVGIYVVAINYIYVIIDF